MPAILKTIPLLLSVYFYFIPNILVRNYIEKFIQNKLNKYTRDHSDNTYIKGTILKIVGFIAFIGTYGSIIISVLCDSSFKWYPLFFVTGIAFVIVTAFLFIQYTANDLTLSKANTYIERIGLAIAVVLIIYNHTLS